MNSQLLTAPSSKLSSVAFPRKNNLECLRLLFALQVVLGHLREHLGLGISDFIFRFPGVPAFFFVSGFLIYASYLNAPGMRYFQNRFLRLFPALVFVSIGGLALAIFVHGWTSLAAHPFVYSAWLLSQITLGQAYNPALFRDIGVGVINGSLWTLTTEILFYASVPLIAWAERRFRWIVPALIGISFAAYALYSVTPRPAHRRGVLDVLALTPVVWGWMFGFGILFVKYFTRIQPYLKYALLLVLPMIFMWNWGSGLLFASNGNQVGLVYYLCYVTLVAWLAFAAPYLYFPLDLSYGTYIWHMPILNLLLVLRIGRPGLALALILIMAAASWFLVEKPFLRLKRKSLRPIH